MAIHKPDDSSAASSKATKHEVEKKGLGVPQSTGVAHTAGDFSDAPVVGISGVAPAGSTGTGANNLSAGTDNKVRAAGADGSIEVAGGAPTGNVPSDVDKQ